MREYKESRQDYMMRELHGIRESSYRETKHMSAEEYVKHINESAKKTLALKCKRKHS